MNLEFLTPSFILALLIAITLHEFAHAWAADREGDDTPRSQDRLNINPLKHLDLYGTIALLLVGFGWGKPVPINPAQFQRGYFSEFIVASAGILMNLGLAMISILVLKIWGIYLSLWFSNFLFTLIFLNLILFIFNLIPLYPLDGEKILKSLLPDNLREIMEQYQNKMAILLLILIVMDQVFNLHILGGLMNNFVGNFLKLFNLN